ncbi:MAG: all-trans-retinol 13,14-reductase [Myxococcota bacterium]
MSDDIVIVGSGIAALSFGALAASAGRKVCLLEAHYHPGGYGHTFDFASRSGGRLKFNAQLHYVWNCGPGETVHRILERLDLHRSVTFERYDPNGFDRMRIPGFALDIPGDAALLKDRLSALFPGHAAGLARFVDEVHALESELTSIPSAPLRSTKMLARLHRYRRVVRWRNATLQDAFDHFGLPLEAQALLGLQWPDFLLPPNQLSLFAWTLLFVGYQRGAYYPTRHFEHVIDSLVGVIRSHGGEVHLRHRVREFVSTGDAITGVIADRVTDDGVPTGESVQFDAPTVVCNMDPRQAATMIGLDRFSADVRRRLDYQYSPSSFMAYLAVEGLDLAAHGFGKSNLFHAEDPDLNRSFHRMYREGNYDAPSFAMTTPTLLTDDRDDCPAGTQIVELLTVAQHDRFMKLKLGRPKAYVQAKRDVLSSLLDVVEAHYVPDFRDHIVFEMTGSPTTNERYCLAPAGHAYGSSLIPSQMGAGRLDHHSSVPGLHFCSASSGYAGFAGCMWTGATLWETLSGERFLE